MKRTFTTIAHMQSDLQSACKKAIADTTQTVADKLRECINEQYYNDPEFTPEFYHRTEAFLNSVAQKMLSSNSAMVYLDTVAMHYRNSFNPKQVVSWAAESKHGSDDLQTDTQDFWTSFMEWCDNNLVELLR